MCKRAVLTQLLRSEIYITCKQEISTIVLNVGLQTNIHAYALVIYSLSYRAKTVQPSITE